MNIALADLIWLLLVSGGLAYWWHARGTKERAQQLIQRHCRHLELQLLDDSVALRGFWLKRDERGRLRIWRSYNFEFSSLGDDRYQGRLIMLGDKIEAVDMEAHRIDE